MFINKPLRSWKMKSGPSLVPRGMVLAITRIPTPNLHPELGELESDQSTVSKPSLLHQLSSARGHPGTGTCRGISIHGLRMRLPCLRLSPPCAAGQPSREERESPKFILSPSPSTSFSGHLRPGAEPPLCPRGNGRWNIGSWVVTPRRNEVIFARDVPWNIKDSSFYFSSDM